MEMLNRHSIELGKRRGDAHRLFSPARWMDCVPAGRHAPTSSDYLKISTWNVRSLYLAGKLANIAKEMIRMNIDVLGVSETFWKDRGRFRYHLPNNEDFSVIFAGRNCSIWRLVPRTLSSVTCLYVCKYVQLEVLLCSVSRRLLFLNLF